MAGKPRFTVRRVAGALRRTAGIKTAAAELLAATGARSRDTSIAIRNCRRLRWKSPIAPWIWAEGKLLQAINQGNMTAIIFYLKTKGKHRGYVQKLGPGGTRDADNHFDRDVVVNIDLVPTGYKSERTSQRRMDRTATANLPD